MDLESHISDYIVKSVNLCFAELGTLSLFIHCHVGPNLYGILSSITQKENMLLFSVKVNVKRTKQKIIKVYYHNRLKKKSWNIFREMFHIFSRRFCSFNHIIMLKIQLDQSFSMDTYSYQINLKYESTVNILFHSKVGVGKIIDI